MNIAMIPSEPHIDIIEIVRMLRLFNNQHLSEEWKPFYGRQIFFTLRGRTAVALAINILKLTNNDCILFPAYHCGCELEAIIYSKVKLKFYDVSLAAEPILDLSRKPPNEVKALYVIHSFGFQQDLTDIRNWCDSHSIYLIEDCASIAPSAYGNSNVGIHGDATIFSPRKFIGTNYGGMLVIKSDLASIEVNKLSSCPRSVILRELVHYLIPNCAQLFKKINQLYNYEKLFYTSTKENHEIIQHNAEFPDSYRFSRNFDDFRASHPWFKIIMQLISWHKISEHRVHNYKLLSQCLNQTEGLKAFIKQIPNLTVPLNYPILVNNRNKFVSRMLTHGIEAIPWWSGFHSAPRPWKKFPNATMLKNHIITLPIHQGLLPDQINRIADSLIHATIF